MSSITLNSTDSTETISSTVLAVGPWQRGEFEAVRDQIGKTDGWLVVQDCETASELLVSNEVLADVILLAAPLPATYEQAQIETLRRLAPLAQIVVVAGSWCEGELRTGKPQQGVLRLYWHEFAHWWHARPNQTGDWSPGLDGPMTPRSNTADITFETSVAIRTPVLASYEALATALRACGANCRWVREYTCFESAAIGIWDGGQLDPEEWQSLERFAMTLRENGGKLLVLLDFPRKEHVARLQVLGCEMVFGKPYVLGDLVTAIARL